VVVLDDPTSKVWVALNEDEFTDVAELETAAVPFAKAIVLERSIVEPWLAEIVMFRVLDGS
jgi:hypothetical protein